MSLTPVRVRFAPSPTGFMHMGNVRAALLNYLFARQHKGAFILRIEDTDAVRNLADGVHFILEDLKWLGITPDEGPGSAGNEPYIQSKRQELYLQSLAWLEYHKRVYRCFCTPERLNRLRNGQRAAGMPPRYDGACRDLSTLESNLMIAEGTPFIWRFRRKDGETLQIPTLGDPLSFEMDDFYDFPLTRADESFTFLFTNAVDDMDMNITHVIRGSDHLSNTAMQAELYAAFGATLPVFIHLPLLCGSTGQKLSKRDFGFSLKDIQHDGILPEALVHYLLTIGSTTIDHPLTREALVAEPLEKRLQHTGQIMYDLQALRAINKNYMHFLSAAEMITHLNEYAAALMLPSLRVTPETVAVLQKEANSLVELRNLLERVLNVPTRCATELIAHCGSKELALSIVDQSLEILKTAGAVEVALETIKKWGAQEKIPLKVLFGSIRYAFVGLLTGIGMGALAAVFSTKEAFDRLHSLRVLLDHQS